MNLIARLVIVAALACPIVAVWPSDRWVATALLAYVPPQLAILVTVGALLVLGRKPDRHVRWVLPGVIAIALNIVAIVMDMRVTPRAAAPGFVRVVHWQSAASPPDADIVCLSGAELSVTARWRVEHRRRWNGERARALHVLVHSDPPLSIVVAHVDHNLRRDAIQALADELARLDPAPDVVVGDLNTPDTAHSLRPLREKFVDARRTAGSGAAYTWPKLLPVMRIDHAFVCGRFRVARYETGWGRGSDHAWQRITLAGW